MNTAKETPYVDEEGTARLRRVEWYLKKVCTAQFYLTSMPVLTSHHQGESVQDKDPVVHYFFHKFLGPSHKTVLLTLHTSDAETPSVWPDASVRELCKIQCEIDVSWKNMQEMRDPNGKLLSTRKVDNLTLSMSFEGAPKWTLKAGGQMTSQEAEVEYA